MILYSAILLILFGCLPIMPDAESIIGSRETCSNEGEIFNVDTLKIKDMRCFTCICKNGFVECRKEPCPGQDGCHMLLGETIDACSRCYKCKGCLHHDTFYESGTEWKDKTDPCTILTCKAGVVTESSVQCYTPCQNPIPPAPGQCCPTCPGCRINGQIVGADQSVAMSDDPCLRCKCEAGRMICEKRSCPVLHCLPTSLEWRPGDCCPRCNGSRRFVEPPKGQCLLNNKLHPAGHSFVLDKCTVCSCLNATTVCKRQNCPPLDCPPEKQSLVHGQCCPYCPPDLPKATSCTDHTGRSYQNGEFWQVDACKSCVCRDGQVRCARETCPQLNSPCPPNSKLMHHPGTCCPRCVESDGVCTVFGDPHYRTFDGKFFSFQGACKYLLTAECVNNTFYNSSFQIRVTNDARNTKTSSWTKTVSIKLRDMGIKVNLGNRMRVKINGKTTAIPFILENKVKITRTNDSVLVETRIGIKVLWDGNSFLEVAVSPNYKGRLCGLCGNYNSVSRDDLTIRSGRVVYDAEKFGESWRVGTSKACSRPTPKTQPACNQYLMLKRSKDKFCKLLTSEVFAACHIKLNFNIYFKSCLLDMCECPREKCYCESFTAYAHECERLGVHLPNWRSATGCPAIQSTSRRR